MINLFWSKYDNEKSYTEWRSKKINVSPFHQLTLKSHRKNKVILYSYQEFNKGQIPNNIEVKDADYYFPAEVAFQCLNNGHSIAHISDAVRLKSASENLGVVLDMDAVILKEMPKEEGWFATMPAKMTGGFAPRWGKSHPPIYIADKSWDGKALFNFPLKVSKDTSKHIESLSHKIMHTLLEQPKQDSKAWNYVIWSVKKIINYDKKAKVYQPISFHPLPAWLGKNKCYSLESPTRLNNETILFGYKLPSIKEMLKDSFMIHHFFESTFNKSKIVSDNFWLNVSKDSLLGKEAEYIVGEDWKIELTELSNRK